MGTSKQPRKPQRKTSLGKQDRWPSDYGVRDEVEEEGRESEGSWVPGEKGQGREGRSKGYGGSAGSGTGPSGPEGTGKRR